MIIDHWLSASDYRLVKIQKDVANSAYLAEAIDEFLPRNTRVVASEWGETVDDALKKLNDRMLYDLVAPLIQPTDGRS